LKSITIISVNKNNFNGLLSTLNSLNTNIKSRNLSHLIIDGQSIDLELSFNDLKKQYVFDFISEKDNGIYEAMNKGIRLSTNDRILFLNSGDSVIDHNKFKKFINTYSEYDFVYSNVVKITAANSELLCRFPKVLSLDYMICFGLPHQATIINKSLFKKIGFYNESFTIISDWVFFMEALFYHNSSYKHVDEDVIYFDGSGISNQKKYLRTIIKEQVHYISLRFPQKLVLYKTDSPYVKKYFRQVPRWKRFFLNFLFQNFNYI